MLCMTMTVLCAMIGGGSWSRPECVLRGGAEPLWARHATELRSGAALVRTRGRRGTLYITRTQITSNAYSSCLGLLDDVSHSRDAHS